MAKRKTSNTRNLKVYRQYAADKEVPTILLKGQWLEEFGFGSDTTITVTCEDGKLVITPREPEKIVYKTFKQINDGELMLAEEKVYYK